MTADAIGASRRSDPTLLRVRVFPGVQNLPRFAGQSLRWALAPANREETVALLAGCLEVAPAVAAATYVRAVDPAGGLAPDARLDLEGFRTVLTLRAELQGSRGDRLPAADRYYDPQYYERALASLAS